MGQEHVSRQRGEFHLLLYDLRFHDMEYFFKVVPNVPHQYEELLSLVTPSIIKWSQKLHTVIGIY